MVVRFVLLKKFEELTGWTVKACERMIEEGIWIEGRQYRRQRARILVDLQGYEKWVETPPPAA